MILGLCQEHSVDFELEFLGIEQVETLHTGLANNDIHLASEATIITMSSFSDIPGRNITHPFVVAPTCKHKTTDGQRILLSSARDAVNAKASCIGGRLYCISSDGDAKCQNTTLLFTFIHKLDRNNELFKRLCELLLFNYHCSADDLMGNIDLKHIHSPHSATNQAAPPLQYHQDVKLMYDLLSALAVLPEAWETDTPAFKNNRCVLCLLGTLYRHMLEVYTNVNLLLHKQLVHITSKNIFFCIVKTQLDDPSGNSGLSFLAQTPSDDTQKDVAQLASQITATGQCDNILAEHPEWAHDLHRLRLPVWQNVAGDVSAKINHISPQSWLGNTYVGKISTKTTWMSGRQIAERELLCASWEPPFKSMEETGGFSIFCPFRKGKMVLLYPPEEWESHNRNEDDDEHDVEQLTAEMIVTTNTTSEAAPPADSDTPFLPDFDDLAQEAVANLELAATQAPEPYLAIMGSTKKQHKASILRIYSSRFSIAESRDCLECVCGFSQHNKSSAAASMDSNEAIAGEPMVLIEDPVAILIMELQSTHNLPRTASEEGNWEWSSKFVTSMGTSKITEVDCLLLQLLNPAVLPASNPSKNAASMELVTQHEEPPRDRIHPDFSISHLIRSSYYALAEGEEIALKTISTTKKCNQEGHHLQDLT
ncbi:hypothetical protein B0H10DRAFT_1941469 [Mycena sp. CBHHK59/15]|nr:hypothetical protein B0H10DRAFT_1941469 [Mycena sp. CBHHK59/15]